MSTYQYHVVRHSWEVLVFSVGVFVPTFFRNQAAMSDGSQYTCTLDLN